mgnify:CR=1 FL=1
MDKVSYALGMSIGRQLQQMNAAEVNVDDFAQAIKDVFASKTSLTDSEAQQAVQDFFQRKAEEQAGAAKAEGEAFLAENAKKEGVVSLPSGLQYQVLREGDGRKPAATDQVECHYEGTLINGQVFDSSYQRGQTATFGLNQVIAGPRACSSCRKAPSIASSFLTTSPTVSVVPARAFLPSPPSSLTWSS